MKATVLREHSAVLDGGVYPAQLRPGQVIEGNIAAVGVAEGWAKAMAVPANKAMEAPENKAGMFRSADVQGADCGDSSERPKPRRGRPRKVAG